MKRDEICPCCNKPFGEWNGLCQLTHEHYVTQEHVDLPESSPVGRSYRARITALESQNARMKAALTALRSRDTLHLGPLADGGWARELIDAALKESP